MGNGRSRAYRSQHEDAFREEMELLFSVYGPRGVPMDVLHRHIRKSRFARKISDNKLQAILKVADRNQDTFVTWDEFTARYNSPDMYGTRKSAIQQILDVAVTNVAPDSQKAEFIQGYDCKPPPLFLIVVSALEIGVFIYFAVDIQRSGGEVTSDKSLPLHDPFRYRPRRRYEAWRFLTYMFIHNGYIHLINNLIMQLIFGLPLELYHEWKAIMPVYIAGVIGGSLAHSVTDFNAGLAGASGGCYAIIGAHLANVIINWKEMNYGSTDLSNKRWPIRLLASAYTRIIIILGFLSWDTAYAFYRRFRDTGTVKVGIAAHFGGLITGLLLGILLLKNVRKEKWERVLGWCGFGLYIAAVLTCILLNIYYKHYPQTDWSKCC